MQVERSTKEALDAESRLVNARSQLEQIAAEQRLPSTGPAQGPVSAVGVLAPNPAPNHAPGNPPRGVASAPAAAAQASAGDQASMQGSQASVAARPVPARAAAPVEAQTTQAPRRDADARPVVPPAASSSAVLAETMVRRGDAMLQRGDVSAARLLYERAPGCKLPCLRPGAPAPPRESARDGMLRGGGWWRRRCTSPQWWPIGGIRADFHGSVLSEAAGQLRAPVHENQLVIVSGGFPGWPGRFRS